MMPRRRSKAIRVGDVTIGGDAPIVVQSMTKTFTHDVQATVREIRRMEERGCEIVRVAVPDMPSAEAIPQIKKHVRIPIIADIHFHYQLALAALDGGIDGLRLNPGNIRNAEQVSTVVKKAKERQVPIRVGVNFGSLPPVSMIGKDYTSGKVVSRLEDGVNTLAKVGEESPDGYTLVDHMVDTAMWEIGILEDLDFDLIKISLKAFDVPTTIEVYKRIAEMIPYPLHLGITEAGTPKSGAIRSAVGLGTLLYMGIGDTIRVSLAGDPSEEVDAGYEILKSLNLRSKGATLIACPSCGRADVDIRALADTVDHRLREMGRDLDIKIAVMGCEVNGPGEAKDADVGIAAGKGRAVIFSKGKKVRVIQEADFFPALMEEIDKLAPASN
ncbi:MAG: flavodoxin-dependent (E)-4-hydroxy-3-methylbut-2-enyl-diphosphate synthase [Dehalococcoidia bacterium]